MKIVALLSGGKDSLFNLYLALKEGHELVAIGNLKPPSGRYELDSYMYQSVGHQAISHIAEALGVPLYQAEITGDIISKDLEYDETAGKDGFDEVEQLHDLLKDMRFKHNLNFDAISVGAIASTYQKSRCENICKRLHLEMLAYLWNQDQDKLLQSMIDNKFEAILIKVACMGLGKNHLGQSIEQMQDHLRKLHDRYGTNICGEGGEYETLVLDCPLYKKRLVLDDHNVICHSDDVFAPVYLLEPTSIHLVEK